MSEEAKRTEIEERVKRLHSSLPETIAGHRKDKCDVCFLVNSHDSLKAMCGEMAEALKEASKALDHWALMTVAEPESTCMSEELSKAGQRARIFLARYEKEFKS